MQEFDALQSVGDPAMIAATVFACVFGGALLGMFLGSILPEHHVGPETRDAIKVSMAMVATLAALVLGLLTASAKGSLDDKETALRTTAGRIVLLDRTLAAYGPETQEARALLKQTLIARIGQIWPEEDAEVRLGALGEGGGIEAVQMAVLRLSPKDDAEHWLQSRALDIAGTIATSRWLAFEQIGSSSQWILLAIVVFWLSVVFMSFGLFAPRNAVVMLALLVAALSVAGAIYLILEMDQPYEGAIKLPSAPLRAALEQLGRS